MKNKIKIITVLVLITLILIIGYWFINSSNDSSINTNTSPTNNTSFFPVEALKRVVNTVSNTINSNPIIEVITENLTGTTTSKNYDILRAVKIAEGPIEKFGFTNKTGSTTLFYLLKGIEEVKFIPIEATSTLVLGSSTDWVVNSPNKEEVIKFNTLEGSLKGELTNLKNKITTSLTISPLTSWIITWPEASILSLQSKPSSGMDGYLYTFNLRNRSLNKILGPLPGLNSLISPDGKNIIYSTNQNGQVKTYIKSINSQEEIELGFKTLTDKCIWYNSKFVICAASQNIEFGNYPDSWYQGINSFNDDIWLTNSEGSHSYLISIFGESLGSELIDATDLKISPNKEELYFLNKRDSSLWKFDLTHAF